MDLILGSQMFKIEMFIVLYITHGSYLAIECCNSLLSLMNSLPLFMNLGDFKGDN